MTTQAISARIRKPRASMHRGSIALFVGPFAVLFVLFYILPIIYAIYQSLLTVEREGTFGKAREVFGGLTQYVQVFQNEAFWASVLRVMTFGIVQVPVMLGFALLLALLLDSPLIKGRRFFRLAFFVPYAVPGVIAAIMWGFPLLAETLAVYGDHRRDQFSRSRPHPVVDRQRRDLDLRRLQHADHLFGVAGDSCRALRSCTS